MREERSVRKAPLEPIILSSDFVAYNSIIVIKPSYSGQAHFEKARNEVSSTAAQFSEIA